MRSRQLQRATKDKPLGVFQLSAIEYNRLLNAFLRSAISYPYFMQRAQMLGPYYRRKAYRVVS